MNMKVNIGEKWNPDYVVLGPGSSKGFCILGALHGLMSKGYLDNVKGYLGSSVGSIISLLIVVGYSPAEIMSIASSVNMFTDWHSYGIMSKLEEMKSNFGFISSGVLDDHLEVAIKYKLGFVPTMKELYNLTGLDLVLTTFNMSKKELVYISHRTHPDMRCITAAIASSSIPLLFYKFEYNDEIYVDGGLVDPLPIAPVDDGNNKILGIFIENPKTKPVTLDGMMDIPSYTACLITTPISRLRDYIIKSSSDKCKFVSISSDVIDVTGISLDAGDKLSMIMDGIEASRELISSLCSI